MQRRCWPRCATSSAGSPLPSTSGSWTRSRVVRTWFDRLVSFAVVSMEFTSTRDSARTAGFAAALLQGLAPDGGLYVPRDWPAVRPEDFGKESDLPGVATHLLTPFASGDA